jgi:MFS family permease
VKKNSRTRPGRPVGWAVLGSIYLPALLFSIGEGSVIPIAASRATQLGAPLALGSVIAGSLVIGQLLGDIPSGYAVSRFGERNAMLASTALSFLAIVLCILAPNAYIFGLGILVLGVSSATFGLARHALLTSNVPKPNRARALSLLGGVARLGLFIGPAISAVIITNIDIRAVFLVHAAACLAVVAVLLILPPPPTVRAPVIDADAAMELHNYRGVFLRLGSAVALLSAIRSSKSLMVPLWGLIIGIPPAEIAVIASVSAGAELILFYFSGQLMDRFGRLSSVLPCVIGLTIGHILLPFVHTPAQLVALGIVLGLFNGLGSGIVLTLGADIAPQHNPAPILGIWRLFSDGGAASAPLIIAGIVAVSSLAIGTWTVAVLGAASAVLFTKFVPRYSPTPGKRKTSINSVGDVA